jgi:hypothetical protein
MGIRRKIISAHTLGLVPFRSNGDKIAKQGRRDARQAKVDTKKDRNLQEQILAEQRRANDLKERELALQHPPMEDPPTDYSWLEYEGEKRNDKLRRANSGGWWGYSDPAKKSRRG